VVPARETTVRSGLLPASRGGLATAIFARRCQLADLLIDRVIVTDGDVEIR
jgi:hypothetical protein